MLVLDISGWGLFNNPSQFLHILGQTISLLAGSFAIVLFTVISLIAAVVYAVYKAARRSSVMLGLRLLLVYISYLAGAILALFFVLLAGVFFSISLFKLLLVAGLIVLATSFVVREFILFFLFKKFGKYFFYANTAQQIHKTIFNGEEKS